MYQGVIKLCLKIMTLNLCGFKLMTFMSELPGTISDNGIRLARKLGTYFSFLGGIYFSYCI